MIITLHMMSGPTAADPLSEGSRGGGNNNNAGGSGATVGQSYQPASSLGPIATSDLCQSPPPVPPKSEAVSIASLIRATLQALSEKTRVKRWAEVSLECVACLSPCR